MAHASLASLFSDIADAIRAKTGGSAAIVADDFPTAIAAIPTGGGGPNLPDPSTVTDLTNTTWLMNNTLDTASLPNQSNAYDVLFQTGTKNKINGQLVGGYVDDYRYLGVPAFVPYNLTMQGLCRSTAGSLSTKQVGFLLGEYNMWYGADGWGNYYTGIGTGNGKKVWTFLRSGGGVTAADHTNANLITWMKNNATLINID